MGFPGKMPMDPRVLLDSAMAGIFLFEYAEVSLPRSPGLGDDELLTTYAWSQQLHL